jgi:hypothetical protein
LLVENRTIQALEIYLKGGGKVNGGDKYDDSNLKNYIIIIMKIQKLRIIIL